MKRLTIPLVLALLAVPTCASLPNPAPADATFAAWGLPPIPSWAPSPLGRIPVRIVHDLHCGTIPAYGCFHYNTRVIELRDSLPPILAWTTLRHELVHSALFHAGITFDDAAQENRVADALANQQVLEMIGRWPR